MSESRTTTFRRNELLEKLLAEVNGDLQLAENLLLSRYQQTTKMKYPLIMVMGPLRSGTTLLTQWLANTGVVAYPTNLLSRFYQAPIIGAKIQLLLTDPRYNFRDELGEFIQQLEYRSENGKTKGVLAPNEFWYFWRRFLPEPERDVWTDEALQQGMDFKTMRSELIGLMDVFQKPFAAKGMLFNYNIPFLDSIFDKVLFIQIKRDPVDNVASVLESRKRQLGTDTAWYSFKIPEYEKLAGMDPISQAVGQVCAINRAVDVGMSKVADSRKLTVEYEEFCGDPARIFREIVDRLGLPDEQREYAGPRHFQVSRAVQGARAEGIKQALWTISSNDQT